MRAWPCGPGAVTTQVVAVQLDQVEHVEKGVAVMVSVADTVERGNAVIVTHNGLAVDDAWLGAQPLKRLDDPWEAVGEIVAGTAIKPHPLAILASNDPKAIVLDLVNPQPAGRRLVGFCGKTRPDEPGRQGTWTQRHGGLMEPGSARLDPSKGPARAQMLRRPHRSRHCCWR